ncbi:MAG: hypothetical protein HZC36_16090 [Armatimonadetes bacterium]|nr:hypothetical protein [Armatimonadota bacterium]
MFVGLIVSQGTATAQSLERLFISPPPEARPWVYWMVMDGNFTAEGISADLQAMKQAGIGGAILLEVDVGVPRGPVRFMSEPWQRLVKHALSEADRLGIQIALGAGPGWCGTGGPWVKPENSMQHLVGSETQATGPVRFDAVLAKPAPRRPFFGEATLTPELREAWLGFYRDVAVLAFRTPSGDYRIPDIDEKALYYRAPYSSQPGVKPYLLPDRRKLPASECIPAKSVIDLTSKLTPEGRLVWDVPPGEWTIVRFGRRITGQTTRPAPEPGLGLESDKFDRAGLDAHFDSFIETLLKVTGEPAHRDRGLTTIHFDSWEMGSQNWSARFREEFRQRRGYDPLRYLPAMLGRVVESVEVTERFLWDLRRTAQELVIENHAIRLKELSRKHGLQLSIEPYDLNPAGDLALGGVADAPQCEFWSRGFNTTYSAFEAVSAAHTMGRKIVGAEAFTSDGDAWQLDPAMLKAQGDWALCAGINRFIFHRYAHQPWLDRFPGMTFGPYGVHWDRTQTWWPMASGYHTYLARCQAMLRRGLPVADILYLDAEGAPNVFRAPASATLPGHPDRRGYSFDGCAPQALIERASVKGGRLVFPDGMSYRLLVLPRTNAMSPQLLRKIKALVEAGATVVGSPPSRAQGLQNYPQSDAEVNRLAAALWAGKRVIRDEKPAALARPAIADAKWIWYPEGNPAVSAPVGSRMFLRKFELPGQVKQASFSMTADNRFELLVNGKRAASGDNFHTIVTADVAGMLKPGKNVIQVVAQNDGTSPNPAGLIGALKVTLANGTSQVVLTDKQWLSAMPGEADGRPAAELGAIGAGPWGLAAVDVSPELYPPYSRTARILEQKGVAPDFEADADLRYIHRTEPGEEVYFVGNRTAAPVSANCRFRVAGLRPEIWDPMTGERRPLPEYREAGGRTIVPLRFESGEAYFVVFRRGPKVTGPNFAKFTPMAELKGQWEVSFDPNWGGPAEPVIFEKLEDWTKRAEDQIRFYSGMATYRKTFDAPFAGKHQGQTVLDLGPVKNQARVNLNGRDLGIVWCAPWRASIPSGLLKAKSNTLKIEVANLWPNRLIKDSGLPEERRLTRTTWNPYKPTDALLPSGLFGPVRVLLWADQR